jgi:hypothetical protein
MATRYSWTVSVIAIYNEDEPVLKQAYQEFEDSIKSQERPSKDISFIIFFYNSTKKSVIIKKSELIRGKLKLVESKPQNNVDIYEPEYKILRKFFSTKVAKTRIDQDEEHKHLLITWGHGAGLAFFKEEIKKELESMLVVHDFKEMDPEMPERLAGEIITTNQLTANLSLDNMSLSDALQTRIINKYLPTHLALKDRTGLVQKIKKLFRVISAGSLAEIINDSLRKDKSTCIARQGQIPLPSTCKIQILLCLTCYVNMVETGYALKDVVNVYIAPQTEIPFYGYNYKELFKLLRQEPGVDEVRICKTLTHLYLAKFLEPAISAQTVGSLIHGINYKEEVSFAGIYLAYFERLAVRIGDFTNFVTIENSRNPRRLSLMFSKSRRKCLPVTIGGARDTGIIDYENFIAEFLECFEPTSDERFALFFCSEYLISGYFSTRFCRSTYNFSDGIFTSVSPGSFSIFLPDPHISAVEGELLSLYNTSVAIRNFLTVSKWDTIIRHFNP